MKTVTQIKLDENIPNDVIATRDGGKGKQLSYLETWYVIDRLNQVLGQGNWAYDTVKLEKVFEGEVELYSGKAFGTSYIATVSIYGTVEGKQFRFTDVGYGDGNDKKSPGKAHELATKEAVSDAVKRCAKNLGRSMGLALYDKTQEFVGQTVTKPSTDTRRAVEPSTIRETRPVAVSNSSTTKTEVTVGSPIAKELITKAFGVLEGTGKISKEAFKTNYLQGKGLSTIEPSKLPGIYEKMKQDFPVLQGK